LLVHWFGGWLGRAAAASRSHRAFDHSVDINIITCLPACLLAGCAGATAVLVNGILSSSLCVGVSLNQWRLSKIVWQSAVHARVGVQVAGDYVWVSVVRYCIQRYPQHRRWLWRGCAAAGLPVGNAECCRCGRRRGAAVDVLSVRKSSPKVKSRSQVNQFSRKKK
jgi:hypothetical protein